MKCRRAAFKATEILSIANNDVIQERNLQDIAGQRKSPSQIATALESMVVFAMTDDARLSVSSHKSFSKRIAIAPKNKFAVCQPKSVGWLPGAPCQAAADSEALGSLLRL
jgi:hypothetical protein